MKRVTGIGGIFFKSQNPEKLCAWYHEHLGIEFETGSAAIFRWQTQDENGYTVFSPFPQDTNYFDPSTKPFMINFCVENLDWLLEQLRSEGVRVDNRVEAMEYGRFGWILDPEGNRIELWEPPQAK